MYNRSLRIRSDIARINIDGKGTELPRLEPAQLSTSIGLKPLVQQFTPANRYKLLIDEIQHIMPDEDSIIRREDIARFAARLFEVVGTDIKVLQDNEAVRLDSVKNFGKINSLQKQLQFAASQTMIMANDVRTNDNFLQMISVGFANYHKRLLALKQTYNDIHQVQISTSVDLQSVYDPKSTNEQYYLSYYGPLREVLYRMRRTLEALNEDTRRANSVELPSRAINFLANCRNLLLQLDNFLLVKNSVFNKLLSFVVSCQKMNTQKIVSLCNHHYTIHNYIFQAIQKNYYLIHYFDDEIKALEPQRLHYEIQSYFLQPTQGIEQFSTRINLQIDQQLALTKDIRKYLCDDNIEYMSEYQNMLMSKKFKRVINAEKQLKEEKQYFNKIKKLVDPADIFNLTIKRIRDEASQIDSKLRNIQSATQPFTSQFFRMSFLKLQQSSVILHQQKSNYQQETKERYGQAIRKVFITDRISLIDNLIQNIFNLQELLIKIYENDRARSQATQTNALQSAETVISNCQNFLSTLDTQSETNIMVWERVKPEVIKDYIAAIQKAQGEIARNDYGYAEPDIVMKKDRIVAALHQQLFIQQVLLTMYETDVAVTILQNIVADASFAAKNPKDFQVKIGDQADFQKELAKYDKRLKDLLSNPELPANLARMINDRLRVLNEIKLICQMMFKIYRQCTGAVKPKELNNKQVPLYNRQVLQYISLLYRSLKDLKTNSEAIEQQINVAPDTRNFLKGVIEEFITNFQAFYNVEIDKLEQYFRLLSLPFDFNTVSDNMTQQLMRRADAPLHPQWKQQLLQVCKDINELEQEAGSMSKIQNGIFGKLNYGNFKDQVKKKAQWFDLADTLLKQSTSQITLKKSYKDSKVEQTRKKILSQLAV